MIIFKSLKSKTFTFLLVYICTTERDYCSNELEGLLVDRLGYKEWVNTVEKLCNCYQ